MKIESRAILGVCGTLATALFFVGCSEPDDLGRIAVSSGTLVSYTKDVKPILDNRCVSCHACYDAPCQLKLTSHEGIARGGSKDKVYEPTRLLEAPLSRLYFDADSIVQWRARGFHSVLSRGVRTEDLENDGSQTHAQFSTLIGMLDLKSAHSLAAKHKDIDVPLDDASSWQCASDREEFNEFVEDYPQRGMPYALPGLTKDETQLLTSWVAAGAPNNTRIVLTQNEQDWINQWEEFLNQESVKAQLIARYIYEHLFLASLYSNQTTLGRYFQLVRSSTAPGSAIGVVATRRPYDDPGVARVYYRLRPTPETVVAKTHMPYRLDAKKRQDWNEWFYQADYEVTHWPGYDLDTASNPFKTFSQLPVEARYRFMLSEANFTIKGFIKGPVCKGPSAVNVINEHFWVFFVDPQYQGGDAMQEYLSNSKMLLDMPAEKEDTLNLFGAWDDFAENEKQFLAERKQFIRQNLNENGLLNLDLIWDGDGQNPNAAITVYRHHDNASVHKGLNGRPPKTAWVIDYPLLERIHYLLVAGYDVYGNVSHQLLSRIYMDFLRMEGESMFLAFLTQDDRQALRRHWYRQAEQRIEAFMALTDFEAQTKSIVQATEGSAKLALFKKFRNHIGSAIHTDYQFSKRDSQELVTTLEPLRQTASEAFMLLPEVTLLQLYSDAGQRYLSMIRNTGHLNNTSVLFEDLYIAEKETSVSVIPGFIGPRPNAFMRVPLGQLGRFSERILQMNTEADYTRLMDDYGVRRTDPDFWNYYDQFQDGFKRLSPIDFGVLDLTKLENR